MTPQDPNIFSTTSDQAANSFRNPQNIAHLYPGWGANPNYQTPYYDAPYRPAYTGPNPYAAYNRPGFFGSFNQLANPFNKDPYWGNPVDHNSAAFHTMATRPLDAATTAMQRFVAPAIAIGLSQRLLGGWGEGVGRSFGSGLAKGIGAEGMFAGAATRFGSVGGFLGKFVIPFGVGMAGTEALDAGIFQPYIRSRQMAEEAHGNFSGITLADGGNAISGRGLSRFQAAGIGSNIDRMGIRDMMFSSNQVGGIASMGMRAGLFDDVGNTGDILKRVGSIASQIKTILAISRDPNIQTAIEELAKLRLGGASVSGGFGSAANAAYGALGMSASAAGMSVQRLMGTVGTQGQYLFQMNGLTPYLGQLAAGNAAAGFASAARSGLISTSQLARLGGIEGATQNAVAAQLSASSTMFNRMGLANQFFGGNKTSGVVNTVSAFGAMAASDPLRMSGAMGLYGNAMISQQMKSPEGAMQAESQAAAYLRSIGRQPGPRGYAPEEIYEVLTSTMGMNPEMAQAYIAMRANDSNPGVVSQNLKAFRAQGKEQMLQYMNTHSLGTGKLSRFTYGMKRLGQEFVSSMSYMGYGVNELGGRISDSMQSLYNSFFNPGMEKYMDQESGGGYGINMSGMFDGGIKGLKSNQISDFVNDQNIIEALDKAGRGTGPGADAARKLLASGFNTPDGASLYADFLKTQSSGAADFTYQSLADSTAAYDRIAGKLKGRIQKIDPSVVAKVSPEEMKIMDQAVEVHMLGGGVLAASLGKTLQDPRYRELKDTLAGLNSSQQVTRISSLAKGKLIAAGVSARGLTDGAELRQDELNGLLSTHLSADRAIKDTITKSKSEMDGGSFNEAVKGIESSARVFLRAAEIIAGHTGIPGPTTPAGSGENQKGVGRVGRGLFFN